MPIARFLDPSPGVDLQIVDLRSTSAYEDGSWNYPWKTIQKGINAIYGDPDDVSPAWPATPEGVISRMVLVNGGTYEEDLVLPPSGFIHLVTMGTSYLGTQAVPRGITRTVDPTKNPDAPSPVVLTMSAFPGGTWVIWGGMTFAQTGGAQFQNVALYRLFMAGDFDSTGQTSDMQLICEDCSFIGSTFNAPSAKGAFWWARFEGGAPTLNTYLIAERCQFDNGYTVTVTPTAVLRDTTVGGTVTCPGNFPVDFFTNQSFSDNSVSKAGGWTATIPYGLTTPY